jgi:hypothetical protein
MQHRVYANVNELRRIPPGQKPYRTDGFVIVTLAGRLGYIPQSPSSDSRRHEVEADIVLGEVRGAVIFTCWRFDVPNAIT